MKLFCSFLVCKSSYKYDNDSKTYFNGYETSALTLNIKARFIQIIRYEFMTIN